MITCCGILHRWATLSHTEWIWEKPSLQIICDAILKFVYLDSCFVYWKSRSTYVNRKLSWNNQPTKYATLTTGSRSRLDSYVQILKVPLSLRVESKYNATESSNETNSTQDVEFRHHLKLQILIGKIKYFSHCRSSTNHRTDKKE